MEEKLKLYYDWDCTQPAIKDRAKYRLEERGSYCNIIKSFDNEDELLKFIGDDHKYHHHKCARHLFLTQDKYGLKIDWSPVKGARVVEYSVFGVTKEQILERIKSTSGIHTCNVCKY